MRVLHVVPLRRLPTDSDLFEYLAPTDQDIQPGMLVQIPFQKQSLTGVVWRVEEAQPVAYQRRMILGIVAPHPLLTPVQILLMDTFCGMYRYSRSSFLSTHLPTWTSKTFPPDVTSVNKTPLKQRPEVWWYAHRADVLQKIRLWSQSSVSQLIITPTLEDIDELHPLLPGFLVVHSKLTPKKYREIYNGMLSGTIQQIIGTPKALFLPWRELPQIILDQEEHRQYKQSSQEPYFDLGRFFERANISCIRTTPAPKVRTYIHQQLATLIPATGQRRSVGTLGVPGQVPWLSPELIIRLTDELPKSIFWILPRQGFSSALLCQDCGAAVECEQCHRSVRILRQDARHARCGSCQHLQSLPVVCPKCQSSRWKFVGLGVERWRAIVGSIPVENISHVPQHIGTYRDIRAIQTLPHPCLVVIVNGDGLIALPDFAIEEHAWQYLHRLASMLPGDDHLLVQSFQPQLSLWQRWVNHETAAWYDHTLSERRQYGLPPAFDQWQLFCTTNDSGVAIKTLHDNLRTEMENIDIQINVSKRVHKHQQTIVRLTSRTEQPLVTIVPPSAITSDWRVDIDVDSWLP